MSLNIGLSYQNSAAQGFKDGMQAAANILDALILNNITVNIQVTYDTSLRPSAEGGDFYRPQRVLHYAQGRAGEPRDVAAGNKGQARSQLLGKPRG
jgi:hypothetical protein